MGRRRGRSPAGTDLLVAVLVTLVVAAGTALRRLDHGMQLISAPTAVLTCLLIVVGGAALCVRSRHPVAVTAVTLVVTCVYYPLPVPDGPMVLTFVVALYTAAARGRTAAAVVLGALALAAAVAGELLVSIRPLGDTALFLLACWLVVVIALGHLVHVAAVARRAEGRRAAAEERLRIAGELHDALGHRLSLITVQAGAALHLSDGTSSHDAHEALEVIRRTGKEALADLRVTLGLLREVDDGPGLADLDGLVDNISRTGVEVRTVVDGTPRPISAPVSLAAYRVVQESLTNVTRHAAACCATVSIRYRDDALYLEVDDDGGPRGELVAGAGITGMQHRAAALGGELDVRPYGDRGVRVSARLPWGSVE